MDVSLDGIIYEDEVLIAVHKKAGIAVQTQKIQYPSIETKVKAYLGGITGANAYLGIIHRLDQPVEGIVIFAKTPKAASILSEQIRTRQMEKYYLARVCGVPSENEGFLEDYLVKEVKGNYSRVCEREEKNAKLARLSYVVLDRRADETALVSIKLETGRHHQIRIQFANAGFPLLGDEKYNPAKAYGDKGNIALCGNRICFIHPLRHKKMELKIKPYNLDLVRSAGIQ